MPLNGKITAKHFSFGSVANYSCVEGYLLWGNPSVTCAADGHWVGQVPVCQPVECGVPEVRKEGTCGEHCEHLSDWENLCLSLEIIHNI